MSGEKGEGKYTANQLVTLVPSQI
uniref:Uncharacterized protein n=1 Tax=Anguilla anguilla TaxID=7936 RepID=A0A0E9VMW2_ANGAN